MAFLGATVTAQVAQIGVDGPRIDDHGCKISSTAFLDAAVIASCAFTGKRAPVPLKWRNSDTPFGSATPYRLVAAQHGIMARYQAGQRAACAKPGTLVGVVEFRI